jgi:hypothetical protein
MPAFSIHLPGGAQRPVGGAGAHPGQLVPLAERPEELGPEGQQLWDSIVNGRPPDAAPMWAES